MYSPHCEKEYYLANEMLGRSRCMASVRMTTKVIIQTAIFMPFLDARKLIAECTGNTLSETFIETTVVRMGKSLSFKAEKKGKSTLLDK